MYHSKQQKTHFPSFLIKKQQIILKSQQNQ